MNDSIGRIKSLKIPPAGKGIMAGGSLPGYKSGKKITGSTVAGKLPGFKNTPTMGSSQAGVLPDFQNNGPVQGSTVSGTNMVHVGGPNKGSTFPNAMKGGSKPKGSSIPNAKLQQFHATRGKSKL